MTKWEFCSIYPIEEYRHWLVPYGEGFKENFTVEGGTREEVPDDPSISGFAACRRDSANVEKFSLASPVRVSTRSAL